MSTLMFASEMTLLTIVGLPNNPLTAGRGGLGRISPRFPSRLSSIADAGDCHSCDQDQRVAFHQHTVGKVARIAFIGVASHAFLIRRLVENGLPFDAGWKCRTAASTELSR